VTHSGGKPHEVGDRGQRFEVSYIDTDHFEKTYGWTDELVVAKEMAACIAAHPSWKHARINDRRTE